MTEETGLTDLIAARREKVQRLRDQGIEPFPHDFDGVETIASVLSAHEALEAGEETAVSHRVAGRLSARRGAGKAAFLDLVDRSGRMQLVARVDELGERLELLLSFDLGDLIGVDGRAMRTRRGELSLLVDDFTILAKSLRPPPDKHHGLTDVETRYRYREIDLIGNVETRTLFIERARIISSIRSYLDGDGFLELETPILQPIYGGALARPFETHHNALDRTLYLRIATELYLKRAIVGGLERVYELGKNFRNEGLSHKHNPEFTVLEWYEAYGDYEDGANRLEALVAHAATQLEGESAIDISRPWPRIVLSEAIAEQTGIDVMQTQGDRDGLVAAITEKGLDLPTEHRAFWHELVDDLLSKYVEPNLQRATFIFDYPVELSPLAKAHRTKPGLVERWEAFAAGNEIANAFSELNDPDEQRLRFEVQRRIETLGGEAQPFDEPFLQALEHGMPPTSGVGVGIDRLVMALTGQHAIREVLLFPAMRG